MVHAFKVSKIKDISPTEDDCYNEHSGTTSCAEPTADVTSGQGAQVARFADKPHSVKTSDDDTDATHTDKVPPTDIGKELWAYIPFNSVPYLRWYCDKGYCHIPMVDARFTVIDASIDYDNSGAVDAGDTDPKATNSRTTSSPYPWRRLLVGAMGIGGKKITVGSNIWSSSVFVLDITDPTSPVLLWERPLPDNTLTASTPAIVRLSTYTGNQPDPQNGSWYLAMGSGAESVTTDQINYKAGNANIYVFDLRNGDLKATLPIPGLCSLTTATSCSKDSDCPAGETCRGGVAVGDMMPVDLDSDYKVDDIYFGTYGGTTGAYKGKFYRLRLRNDPDNSTKTYLTTPSTWVIESVVVPGKDHPAAGANPNGRPIFASPEVAQDSDGNIWLYFGTGVYRHLSMQA